MTKQGPKSNFIFALFLFVFSLVSVLFSQFFVFSYLVYST